MSNITQMNLVPPSQRSESERAAKLEKLIDELRLRNPANVLVIYNAGAGGDTLGSLDTEMTVAECIYMAELFKHWLLKHALQNG